MQTLVFSYGPNYLAASLPALTDVWGPHVSFSFNLLPPSTFSHCAAHLRSHPRHARHRTAPNRASSPPPPSPPGPSSSPRWRVPPPPGEPRLALFGAVAGALARADRRRAPRRARRRRALVRGLADAWPRAGTAAPPGELAPPHPRTSSFRRPSPTPPALLRAHPSPRRRRQGVVARASSRLVPPRAPSDLQC